MTMNESNVELIQNRNRRVLIENFEGSNQNAPIIGYSQELLVSLIEACKPLVDIVYNILTYATIALENTPAIPPNKLTRDESAAIRLYTMEWHNEQMSLYFILNRTLQYDNREKLRPWFKYLKLFLSALVKIPCAPVQTVWRGVRSNVSNEFPPGTQVTLWKFTSCTTSLTVLENDNYLGSVGERTLFSIEVINGRSIRAHSAFGTEDEVLMLPCTSMKVQSQFIPAADLHIIHLKQIIPDEMLLELPFEGM
ncbi:unnamed protein product [Rotaria sp. Silwood1]|nr:unnamed protein product [Rotaria sp. Silwood1]